MTIKPPPPQQPLPDAKTKLGLPDDQTGKEAKGRIFFINLGLVRYGSTDKAHGAAVFLSLLLFVLLCALLILMVVYPENDSLGRFFDWLSGAFLVIAGVAIGRNPPPKNEDIDE
ncbi:MAG: hypothetical protein AAF092_02505 [Pseudomonadota bacterium]